MNIGANYFLLVLVSILIYFSYECVCLYLAGNNGNDNCRCGITYSSKSQCIGLISTQCIWYKQ